MNPSKKERAVVFIGLHFLSVQVDLSLSARMEDETGGVKKKRVKKKVLRRRGGKGTSRADEGESGGGALLRPQDQTEESKSLPGSRRASINDDSKVPTVAGVL